jgi:zinc and cadmium transporter
MAGYGHVLFFSLIGGMLSLWGGMLLLGHKKSAQTLARYATPFAAGALLGAAFFDLLPEALHDHEAEAMLAWTLGGLVIFFLLEHFLHWFHHHHEHSGPSTPAPLVIIGDTVHNLLDGIAIGAAFLIDVPTGIVAALAVAAHEIPQEIGDFGLLLKFGYSRKNVLLINALSAFMSTVGALLTFWLGSETNLPVGTLLAVTAGMFIYVAASDLIPTIHEQSKKKIGHISAVLLIIGILVVGVTTNAAHKYIDSGHTENDMILEGDAEGGVQNCAPNQAGELDCWLAE